jgi:hypothetical protein
MRRSIANASGFSTFIVDVNFWQTADVADFQYSKQELEPRRTPNAERRTQPEGRRPGNRARRPAFAVSRAQY